VSLARIPYKPDGEVLRDFMRSDAFVRLVRGPIGSGTSSACVVELFRRACQQKPGPDGIRRSRSAVIRGSFPQLKTTTAKTWLEWLPEGDFGTFNWSPPFRHMIKVNDVEWEVFFLAMDSDDHVDKLLSLELTTAWINEGRQIPKSIVDALTGRLRRYPAMMNGGPTWSGLIMDTNAPSEFHWWPIMGGEVDPPDWMSKEDKLTLVTPENWEFFIQPGAMLEQFDSSGNICGYKISESAENINNLHEDYYPTLISGKTKAWIDVYVLNKLGTAADGRPVYPHFNKLMHVASEPIPYKKDEIVYTGIDFGLTPAAVFAQHMNGIWYILDELVGNNMGAKQFAVPLKSRLLEFKECRTTEIYGDPAGTHQAESDKSTPFKMLRAGGVIARPAPTNDIELRVGTVANMFDTLHEGGPVIVISPKCKILIAGLEGEYQYKKRPNTIDEYEDKPDKNRWSHVQDALQYLLMGAGEGKVLMHKTAQPTEAQVIKRQSGIFGRRGLRRPRDNDRGSALSRRF